MRTAFTVVFAGLALAGLAFLGTTVLVAEQKAAEAVTTWTNAVATVERKVDPTYTNEVVNDASWSRWPSLTDF